MSRGTRSSGSEGEARFGWGRFSVACLVALIGALAIWVWLPYSSFLRCWQPIAQSYLPPIVLLFALVLVLLVNPVLRWLLPRLSLSKAQLALVVGVWLVACCLPDQGLMWILPYSITNTSRQVRDSKPLADAYGKLDSSSPFFKYLFPDKLGHRAETPASDGFIEGLPPADMKNPNAPRAGVPWSSWIAPLLAWGAFLIPCWLMVMGMALIVVPQWRDNERLAFPLLTVQESLIEKPEEGHLVPSLFRSWGFWIGTGAVFGFYMLRGLNTYYPSYCPAIPLSWNLGPIFQSGVLRFAPEYVLGGQIFFTFVGLAFFMPTRIAFSIWFTQLAYAGYQVVRTAYLPPFHENTTTDHRMGAMWAMAAAVVWLGRSHWAHVFGCLSRRVTTEEDRRDKRACIMLLSGAVGVFAWLVLFGVQPQWAAFFVVFGFTLSLVAARLLAETGMAYFRIHLNYGIAFVPLAPVSWLSLPVLYFARVFALMVEVAGRMSEPILATHAIGLDRTAPPRRQWRTGVVLMWALVIGFVVCGATTVYLNYRRTEGPPLNTWGLGIMDNAHEDVVRFQEGRGTEQMPYNQWLHMGFGAGASGLLYWACMISPKWPLHPIGILMANIVYSQVTWISIFAGWLAKVLLVRYGGARLYRAARAVFLGLIIGEVLAAVFWVLVAVVLVMFGMQFKGVSTGY